MLAYLARYTHRVAISNGRLIGASARSVTFKVKNYRVDGDARYATMTLDTGEFIRRFLLHVLPKGFHRIRHYGLLASAERADNIELARELIGTSNAESEAAVPADAATVLPPCPCCGSPQRIIEVFHRGQTPKHRPTPRPLVFRIGTS